MTLNALAVSFFILATFIVFGRGFYTLLMLERGGWTDDDAMPFHKSPSGQMFYVSTIVSMICEIVATFAK